MILLSFPLGDPRGPQRVQARGKTLASARGACARARAAQSGEAQRGTAGLRELTRCSAGRTICDGRLRGRSKGRAGSTSPSLRGPTAGAAGTAGAAAASDARAQASADEARGSSSAAARAAAADDDDDARCSMARETRQESRAPRQTPERKAPP